MAANININKIRSLTIASFRLSGTLIGCQMYLFKKIFSQKKKEEKEWIGKRGNKLSLEIIISLKKLRKDVLILLFADLSSANRILNPEILFQFKLFGIIQFHYTIYTLLFIMFIAIGHDWYLTI